MTPRTPTPRLGTFAPPAGRERVVRHATLMPACNDDAPALRFSVEDALNTLDFADCGRLVLVRRLHLHGLPPRPSPAQVSRQLEWAWRAAAAQAWPALHPQAEHAPAVYFQSRHEARITWLWLHAQQQAPQAWFWPQALPEVRDAGTPAHAAQRVLDALLTEAPQALVETLATWPDAVIANWAAALPTAASEHLERLLVRGPVHRMPTPEAATASGHWGDAIETPALPDEMHNETPDELSPHTALRLLPVVHRLAAQRLPPHARWVAALWLAPVLGRAPSAALLARVWQATQAPMSQRPAHQSSAVVSATQPTAASVPPVAAMPERARTEPHAHTASPPRPSAGVIDPASPVQTTAAPLAQVASGLRSTPSRTRRVTQHPPTLPWLADAQATRCGGLLFLVNVLQALRFEPWLAQQPAEARMPFVNHWFTEVLRFVNADAEDPQHAWFVNSAEQAAALDTTATRLWLIRVRRALRQRAGLSLHELVNRPAWVSASPTHIEVVMPLDAADLRLRRRGLDSDPGWRPWFGCIVAFHFVAKTDLPDWPWEPSDG